ncbi:HAD-superfamily hydrolase subfamily IA, variant 1 [Rhodopseudomonas palustris HaA2]|uniref:HAD-superfamily hydrolase subfamily IA, variant 1 n=1 Tax=Rhodopseudomonas palustris (strain HaA2) TaxID=316058 RepID=Q2IWA3_RHOP2|nr:HAD family phosphatase [Rhodopseudomonas palustris]ABD07507.1 HAD-superfamily hydrolase subfamily IA, variant 1 [Rhodopseudomonas palustris HaA2]
MTTTLTPGAADALLFDLGRVVIDFDLARTLKAWAVELGSDPSAMMTALARNDTFHRYETGHVTDAEFFAAVREALRLELSDDQLREGWNAIFIGEMPGIAPLLERAARHLPLYALSNTNDAHIAHFSEHFAELLKPFRELFLSSRIGMRKPNAAAYDHVVRAIGVRPERIVFFDDLAENIAAARVRGLQAVHVRSSADVAQALDQLGL